jgi:hypothetical protein
MSNRYDLTVDEDQCAAILAALDLWSRLGAGQINTLIENLRLGYFKSTGGDHDWSKDFSSLEVELLKIRDLDFPSLKGLGSHASLGIFNREVDPIFSRSYDLIQVIRQRIAQVNYKEGEATNISHSTPIQVCQGTPLASMRQVAGFEDYKSGEVQEAAGQILGIDIDGQFIRAGYKVLARVNRKGSLPAGTLILGKAFPKLDKKTGAVAMGVKPFTDAAFKEKDGIHLEFSEKIEVVVNQSRVFELRLEEFKEYKAALAADKVKYL